MRHRVYGRHLGRNKDQRDNLFKGLVRALLLHGTIQTSSAKAKSVKGLVDKIINLAKDKKIDILKTFVTDKSLRDRLIRDIVPKEGAKTSGFTSMVRLGKRPGDQTMMVRMSLIGAEKLEPVEKEKVSKKTEEKRVKRTTRRRSFGSKSRPSG